MIVVWRAVLIVSLIKVRSRRRCQRIWSGLKLLLRGSRDPEISLRINDVLSLIIRYVFKWWFLWGAFAWILFFFFLVILLLFFLGVLITLGLLIILLRDLFPACLVTYHLLLLRGVNRRLLLSDCRSRWQILLLVDHSFLLLGCLKNRALYNKVLAEIALSSAHLLGNRLDLVRPFNLSYRGEFLLGSWLFNQGFFMRRFMLRKKGFIRVRLLFVI